MDNKTEQQVENLAEEKSFTEDENEKLQIADYKNRNKIYLDCAISYEIQRNTIGINNVYIQNDILIIDITGKLVAEYGDFGLITTSNISECLNKLQELNLFYFDTKEYLKYAGVYHVDITMDIYFPHKPQCERMINAISSFLPIISNNFIIQKYKRNGILIKRKSKNAGWSFVIYCKGEDIKRSILVEDRKVKYTEIIGEEGMFYAERTLRLEAHLYKLDSIRKILNITSEEKGFIKLMDVLNCNEPIFINLIKATGIDIDKIYNSTCWCEFKSNFFFDDNFITEKDLKEIALAEWMTNLLIENNFQMDALRAQLISEYHIDVNSRFAKDLIPKIKENLYNYICFRKPKSVTCVLGLIYIIKSRYLEEAGILDKIEDEIDIEYGFD